MPNVQAGRNLSTFIFAYVPGVEGTDYNSHILGSLAFDKEVMIDGTSACVSNWRLPQRIEPSDGGCPGVSSYHRGYARR